MSKYDPVNFIAALEKDVPVRKMIEEKLAKIAGVKVKDFKKDTQIRKKLEFKFLTAVLNWNKHIVSRTEPLELTDKNRDAPLLANRWQRIANE